MPIDEIDNLDYWRLCDELGVIQAALLAIGVNPSSADGAYVENWQVHERPHGYEAAKTAIANALRKGMIEGRLLPEYQWQDQYTPLPVEGTINIPESSVNVESLQKWLVSRGFKTGFFFPSKTDTPDYLDPQNPRYAPKLAAAVRAWQAVIDPGKKSPKQGLEKWLRENAAQFGLVDDEGNPVAQAVEECSKVANWNQSGGAPKTPG